MNFLIEILFFDLLRFFLGGGGFLFYSWTFLKFLWLLLKVTEVTTDHKNKGKKHKKLSFFCKKGQQKKSSVKGQSRPGELEESLCSGSTFL